MAAHDRERAPWSGASSMTRTADVVVIGGGIHGCSTALHLALRGAEADPGREGLRRPPCLGRQCRRRAPARAPPRRDPAVGRLDGAVGADRGAGRRRLRLREPWHGAGGRERGGARRASARASTSCALKGFTHEELIDRAELRRLVPAVSDHCPGGVVSRRDGAADPFRTTQAFRSARHREGRRGDRGRDA